MTWQTRIWHWAYRNAVGYEYGWDGKRKSTRLARAWTRINNGICRTFDAFGWG